MPTLLQINSCVNAGSTGRIAEEIGQLAIAAGWKSYIAYGRTGRESVSQLIRIGDKRTVCEHAVETRILDNHGFSSRDATRKLIAQIKEIRPDIIHLHNIHGYYINIELLFNYLAVANTPVVWTLHDCWSFTGHCAHFDYAGCDKWRTGCFDCPQKTSYPASFLLDNSRCNYLLKKQLFTSVKNMTIVPVSQWLGGLVRQSFLAEYPIQVIHNGVDLSAFYPKDTTAIRRKYSLSNKFMLLGVASSWSKRKGLYDYCKLRTLLSDEYQIVLVGLTSKQIKDLPLGIIGIQRTESVDELAEVYSVADVFINYTYEDTFPTVNLEALACGTPIITYRTGGSPEAIDSATGIVVEKGNVEASIAAIQEVKSKGKSAYSIACRKRAEMCYNKEERYAEYMDLYEKMLKQ
ncbi:MAG: glycosyltransferase [Alistipes sp.]